MRTSRALLSVLAASCVLAPAAMPAAACVFQCSYTKTRYPIVLVHGLGGFDTAYDVLDYWYGIEDGLRAGGAVVFVAKLNPFETTEVRGEELLAQVDEIRAITGKPKVNLIGHSQGALDARYVAGVRPGLVASVTSVGGPNKGSQVAAFNGGSPEVVGALAALWNFLADEPADGTDPRAAIASLTPAAVAAFNRRLPQGVPTSACGEGAASVNGVRYYSWSGVGVLTNVLDGLDPAVALLWALGAEANDGVVGRCSSHLGDVVRDDYLHNHLDEINQLLGLVPIYEASPVTLFRSHANRLKNAGL